MAIWGILAGTVAVTAGIILKKRSGHKVWYILTAAGACACAVSLFLMICTLLLTEGIQNQPSTDSSLEDQPVDDYWRVRSGYSNDYTVGDGVKVCFTWSTGDDGHEGWAVFDSNNGSFIQLFTSEGYPEQEFNNDIECLQTEDYDGDGYNELGIEAKSGTVLWFKWDEFTFDYYWTESGISVSKKSMPYEVWAVDKLTENQQALYREMRPKILAMESFSYDAATCGYDTLDDVLAAWGALETDEPQIDNYFIIEENIDKNGTTISLDSHYFCSWTEEQSADQAEISEGLEKFEQVCDDIVSGMPENTSTYEKYRYLAQAVSERADYDYSMSLPAIAAPYGIITGQMICQGYAEAYQILCQRADLWCRTVSGESDGMSHAWNLIWLDSGTYHVDITWADEQGESGSEEWMRYFMLTQEKILSDHIISDETVATGSPLFSPKGPEKHISEKDAIDLVKRAMEERNESASVIILKGNEILEGEHCLTLSAGSYSADGQKHTARYHYAVSDSGTVYYMDVLQGADWNLYQWDAAE